MFPLSGEAGGVEKLGNSPGNQDMAKNFIRMSSRRGRLHGQTSMGSLKMNDNDPVTAPIALFHWDVISGVDDSDREYPVFLQVCCVADLCSSLFSYITPGYLPARCFNSGEGTDIRLKCQPYLTLLRRHLHTCKLFYQITLFSICPQKPQFF